MATTQQGKDFGYHFFDEFIDWIDGYCDPEDVFDTTKLTIWALNNNFVEDIYDEDYLIDWAETNGYIKETEE